MLQCRKHIRSGMNCVTISFKMHIYRIKASKKSVESRFRIKQTMKGTRSDESQIERRGGRWYHMKSVFHPHEEEQRGSEDARYRMVLHHTEYIPSCQSHEKCIAQPPRISEIGGRSLLHVSNFIVVFRFHVFKLEFVNRAM